jgi:2-oxoglutarate ferredoxin oxidoreductase subunit alpha
MATADPLGVLEGTHFMDGNLACAEGALAAGCRFVAGYPITPSTEVAERFAARVPKVGGNFIQMEDELASSAAILGASAGGVKAMTVTSGPGFSLMMEHLGLALMMELPCVLINVQRAGPSTGLPTLVGQGDMMQARWGSHGPYEIIALCPDSPQECFDLTVRAFNLAETFRTPVLVMTDEVVGHMTERVTIPPADKIDLAERPMTNKPPDQYQPYEGNGSLVPPMAPVGAGYRFHMTGLTHDERGYPVITAAAQEKLVARLLEKIRANKAVIADTEVSDLEGAQVVLVSYGITSRVARRAADLLRARGVRVGWMRLRTAWPFPEERIREIARRVKAFVVPEINMGQMCLEVERCAAGKARVISVTHAGGAVMTPEAIVAAFDEVLR